MFLVIMSFLSHIFDDNICMCNIYFWGVLDKILTVRFGVMTVVCYWIALQNVLGFVIQVTKHIVTVIFIHHKYGHCHKLLTNAVSMLNHLLMLLLVFFYLTTDSNTRKGLTQVVFKFTSLVGVPLRLLWKPL